MTGGESLNIKGSTISHMAAVHPGRQLLGALQKEEEEEEESGQLEAGRLWFNFKRNQKCFFSTMSVYMVLAQDGEDQLDWSSGK